MGGGVTFKALSAAVLTGCVTVGAPAFAQDFDLSQKPIDMPTLDYLQNNNIQIPQKGVYDKESGTWTEAPAINSPGSYYSISPATEADYTFSYNLTDAEGNLTTHYVKIDFKDLSGLLSSKNISWEEVSSSGDNTIAVKLSDNVTKYYKYTYNEAGYTDVAERIDDTLSSSNVTNVIFKDLQSTSSGGAIYNTADNSNINIIGDFINNSATSNDLETQVYGGAIYNSSNSTIGNITGDFVNNTASGSFGCGGAIYNKNSTIGDITGNFIGNISTVLGSAIYNEEGTIGNIKGNFIGNQNARALENIEGTIKSINGSFFNNDVGGLMNTGTITNVNGDYVNNKAIYSGGGINNTGTLSFFKGNFVSNEAGQNGAGLSNSGSITAVEGNFINNNAKIYGGGLYNTGQIGSLKSSFIGNRLTNYAFASGGAIQNGALRYVGNIGTIEGDFVDNYVEADSSLPVPVWDKGAYYAQGGAIFNINGSNIDKIKGNFSNNYVKSKDYSDGGAIHNSLGSTIGEIQGAFEKNHVIVDDDSNYYSQGGAIQNLAESKIGKIIGDFVGNYTQGALASSGGAIMNSKSAQIDTIIGNFVNNVYLDADRELIIFSSNENYEQDKNEVIEKIRQQHRKMEAQHFYN